MNFSNNYTRTDSALQSFHDADTEELVELINKAYAYQDVHKKSPRTNPQHLRKLAIENELYVLRGNGQTIGCIYIKLEDDSLHFGLLAVDEQYRKQGFAQAMIAAVESYARASNLKSIKLDYMSVASELKGYYERHGFHVTGEVNNWGTIDLIKMEKDISSN